MRGGKPFVAIHPGIWLLPEAVGADCLGHGNQQEARIQVVSPQFPGAEKLGASFSMLEEWFSLIRFAKDLHVVLVQDCAGMSKEAPADRRCYDRPPFPITWARMHDKGRVFYTSWGIVKMCGPARFSSRSCWAGCPGRSAGSRPTSHPTSTGSLRRPTIFPAREASAL